MLRRLPRWASALETAAVFGLILCYIWVLRSRWPWSWAAILAVILASHAWRGETPEGLGFRAGTFGRACREFAPAAAAIAALILAVGMLCGTLRAMPLEDAILSAAFYCFWGLFQQYLLNGYFVNRFAETLPSERPERIALLAALAFSAAHTPNWFLMLATFLGGYLCARVYLRSRNLYFLGLAHGVIGFLLYLVTPDTIGRHFWVGPKWFRP